MSCLGASCPKQHRNPGCGGGRNIPTLDNVVALCAKVAGMGAPDYVVMAMARWCKEVNDA